MSHGGQLKHYKKEKTKQKTASKGFFNTENENVSSSSIWTVLYIIVDVYKLQWYVAGWVCMASEGQ